MDQSERSEGHQFNIASLPGTTNGDKLYDFLRGSLIPSMHPFTVHFDRGHSCSETGSPFEGSMHIYMYSGDGLVFDYQMALPQLIMLLTILNRYGALKGGRLFIAYVTR